MKTQYRDLLERSGTTAQQFIPFEFYLSEFSDLDHAPHARDRMNESLVQHCQELPPSFSMGDICGMCAIAFAELLDGRSLLFSKKDYAEAGRFHECLMKSDANQTSKFYFEGRYLSSLPPQQGQDIKRALVNLTFAERMVPQSHQIRFWLARIRERNGNREAARTAYRETLTENERFKLTFAHERTEGVDYSNTDGLGTGFQYGLFYLQDAGLGGNIIYSDSNIMDRDRSGSIAVLASTRGRADLTVNYADKELITDYRLLLSGGFDRGVRDFYGVGLGSAGDFSSTLFESAYNANLGVERALVGPTFIRIGWQASGVTVTSWDGNVFVPATLPSALSTFHSGPWGELFWDDRDSHVAPSLGGRYGIRGYFPLLNNVTFQEWIPTIEHYFRLGSENSVSIFTGAVLTSGNLPFSAYPTLAGSFAVPGIRANRFTDTNLWVAHLEYARRLGLGWSIDAFGNAGSVGSSINALESLPKFGAGLGLRYSGSRYRRSSLRIDIGQFAGEWVFQAGVGTVL